MFKIATVAALLGVALASAAEGKTKIINPWNNLGGNYTTCPYLEGRWPYCDIFYEPRVVIIERGYDEDRYLGHGYPKRGSWKANRRDYRLHDGSP